MKVLVTGSTGFIGNHVINELLKNGHTVIATGRNKVKASNASWFDKVIFKKFDFSNTTTENIYNYFEEPDILIRLAWSGLPNYSSLSHFEENVMQSYFFIKTLIKQGLTKVNVIGTCLEYGLKEGKLSEDSVPNPTTPYGISKNTLRLYLNQLSKKLPFELNWIRLFYTYGQGQNPKSLLSQLEKAIFQGSDTFNMSEGEQLRDYMPVEEVAGKIVKLAELNKYIGVINCSTGTPTSIRRLVEKHIRKLGAKIELNLGYYPYPSYEPLAFWGDNTKLLNATSRDG